MRIPNSYAEMTTRQGHTDTVNDQQIVGRFLGGLDIIFRAAQKAERTPKAGFRAAQKAERTLKAGFRAAQKEKA